MKHNNWNKIEETYENNLLTLNLVFILFHFVFPFNFFSLFSFLYIYPQVFQKPNIIEQKRDQGKEKIVKKLKNYNQFSTRTKRIYKWTKWLTNKLIGKNINSTSSYHMWFHSDWYYHKFHLRLVWSIVR